MIGFSALLRKEVRRFIKVSFQTIAAPTLTALLYLLIFAHVLDDHVQVQGARYTAFLIPGLVMMSVLQNAFANTSSSLIQSKVTGSIVFVLLSPISHISFFMAYMIAAIIRGLMVGLSCLLITFWMAELPLVAPLWALSFAVLGGALLGTLGLIAGIWAEKYDQLAAFQNFIILPLTMLSGVFYSIHSLPPFWQQVSQFNPFFYMIDGFRYGFFGASDVAPQLSLAVTASTLLMLIGLALALLQRGWKLRH